MSENRSIDPKAFDPVILLNNLVGHFEDSGMPVIGYDAPLPSIVFKDTDWHSFLCTNISFRERNLGAIRSTAILRRLFLSEDLDRRLLETESDFIVPFGQVSLPNQRFRDSMDYIVDSLKLNDVDIERYDFMRGQNPKSWRDDFSLYELGILKPGSDSEPLDRTKFYRIISFARHFG